MADPFAFDQYLENFTEWKRWKNFSAQSFIPYKKQEAKPPPIPVKPVGSGQRLVDMWIKKVEATARKTLGKKQWHRKKEDFIAQSRLVFTKSSRNDMNPLYLLVPSWFIPPHKGTGWLPSVRSITASLAYRLKNR